MSLLTGILQQQSNGTTLKNGLISVWKFNETSGTTSHDAYGTNSGDIINVTINQIGLFGKCYYFDNSDDYVNYGDNLDARFGDMSYSIWVKLGGLQKDVNRGIRYAGIIGKGFLSNNKGFGIYLKNEVVQVQFRGSVTLILDSTININDGQWHHLVSTADRDGLCSIYVDGVLANTMDISSLDGEDINTSDYFVIGSRYASGKLFFDYFGYAMQAVVWDRVLTDSEILLLLNSGNGLAYSNW